MRLAVLGTRSGARLTADTRLLTELPARADTALEAYAPEISEAVPRFREVDWSGVLEKIGSEQADWIYVSGVREEHLVPIAERLGVPGRVLQGKLFGASFPRLDTLERFVTLFAWYAEISGEPGSDAATIERTGLLLVGSAQNVAVLAREGSNLLPRRLERRLEEADRNAPALVSATHALVKEVIRAYVRAVEHLETRLVRIETSESALRDRVFLQRTYTLRSELSRVRTTLRHLAAVTRNLNSRRIAIRGFEVDKRPEFQLLASDAADLYERVDDLNSNLAALVDMRLNVSSFQMNKVMRLLAILTTLALIPAVAGGMLGMNLTDSPWAASLPQVAFWVGSGMALALYLFAVKGWLR